MNYDWVVCNDDDDDGAVLGNVPMSSAPQVKINRAVKFELADRYIGYAHMYFRIYRVKCNICKHSILLTKSV